MNPTNILYIWNKNITYNKHNDILNTNEIYVIGIIWFWLSELAGVINMALRLESLETPGLEYSNLCLYVW